MKLTYEHIVIQIKNKKRYNVLKAVAKSILGTAGKQYLQFCIVDCMTGHNYIKNDWSSCLQNLT